MEERRTDPARLLLHICCGPCATTVIERLADAYDLTGFFYNPNIHPEEEYRRRLDAARRTADAFGVPFVEGAYEPERFRRATAGLEDEPENGRRCPVCYKLRLEESARKAVRTGCGVLASTLTVGPMKKAAVINPIGGRIARAYGLRFLAEDWKKRDGFRRSTELSREHGLYRQHYCGCEYSMR